MCSKCRNGRVGSKCRNGRVRICHVFQMSKWKCPGESDVGLCMASGLAKRMPLRSADFRRILRPNTFKNRKSALRSGILFANPEVMHRPTLLHPTPLYISTSETFSKFVRKNKMLALGVCLPQPCPSAVHRFAASRSCLNYYQQFVSFPQQRIR